MPPCEWSINVSEFLVPVDGWVASPFSEEYVTRKVKIDLFIDLIEPSVRISSILPVGAMSRKYVIRKIETYLNVYALHLLNTLEIANILLTTS